MKMIKANILLKAFYQTSTMSGIWKVNNHIGGILGQEAEYYLFSSLFDASRYYLNFVDGLRIDFANICGVPIKCLGPS